MTSPENHLLAALPPEDYARLAARLSDATFEHKRTMYRAGGPLDSVYFPRSGLMSAVVSTLDGAAVEVAAVGAEGVLGASVALGATHSDVEVFCQVPPCRCWRLPAAEFAAEVARGGALRRVVHGYLRAALTASARLTACNCLHGVEARCARWLLTCRDCVGTDEFPLTQEFLATMLGVRRATVTGTAGALQSAGLIAYRHGRVQVFDGPGLEHVACECYAAIRDALRPPEPHPMQSMQSMAG